MVDSPSSSPLTLRRRPVLLAILILLLTFIQAIFWQREVSACWYSTSPPTSSSSNRAASCFLRKLQNATVIAAGGPGGAGQNDDDSNENNENDDGDHNIRQTNKVPHILYFTHKYNILETKEPKHFYDNIRNTIDLYEEAWSEQESQDTTQVRFLTDEDCADVVNRTEPRLLDYYLGEPLGKYKADICRIAALYETGGYYFDADMKTIKPWNADERRHENCTFQTAKPEHNRNVFFQSILVATARHVVLEKNLEVMLEHYRSGKHLNFHEHGLVGPKTLKAAYRMLNYSAVESQDECLLEEINLSYGVYPNVSRTGTGGGFCNKVVHSAREQEAYFFSRIAGSGNLCPLPRKSSKSSSERKGRK